MLCNRRRGRAKTIEETLPREPVARSSRLPLVGQADVLEGGKTVIRLLRPMMVATSLHVFTCWHPTRNAAPMSPGRTGGSFRP